MYLDVSERVLGALGDHVHAHGVARRRTELGCNSIDILGASQSLSLIMFGGLRHVLFRCTEVVPEVAPKLVAKPHPIS